MAITALITNSIPSDSLYKLLENDNNIISLKDINLPDILHLKMGKIFVNGKWYGCTSL